MLLLETFSVVKYLMQARKQLNILYITYLKNNMNVDLICF